MKRNVTIICDLQFGSTGKGAAAGYFAINKKPDAVITAWSPNAGHTFVDADGSKYVHRALANGVVSPNLKFIMIAPGSILDLDRLKLELEYCSDLVENAILVIHENAAILKDDHVKSEEKTMTGIGSTKKGSGAALIEKLQRQIPDTITANAHREQVLDKLHGLTGGIHVVNTRTWLGHLNMSRNILVEGAQGFSLGVNSGFYPYCTSRECTPAQIMSDTLISRRRVKKVVGVMRTYPIRVANRHDEDGNMVGYSGPCYMDQTEIQWRDIGFEPEMTTVTQLPRRLFTFSSHQTEEALSVCAPDEIWLSFCDYLSEDLAYQMAYWINGMYKRIIGKGNGVRYMSFGPSVTDVRDTTDEI